jgi:dipeptidyl aminopeptidase/acylaminoacyl peptidase
MGIRRLPCGTWPSPLSAERVASQTVDLDEVLLDGDDVYWLETRPGEGGRAVIVRRSPQGRVRDVTPPPYSARTTVHEYGGGSYVVGGGVVVFSNFADQRLYRHRPGEPPLPLVPPGPLRYADMVIDAARNRLLCVVEDHSRPGRDPDNFLAAVSLVRESSPYRLVGGRDFFASPRLSPDGARLAWLAWDHPNMPWDGTELWVGALAGDGQLAERVKVAGGPQESVVQPEWGPDGTLYFASDRTGWWNLFAWRGGAVEPVYEAEAECGVPQWRFRMSTFAVEPSGRYLIVAAREKGVWRLGRVDVARRTLCPLDVPFTGLSSVRCGRGGAVCIAASPREAPQVVRVDPETGRWETLGRAETPPVDPRYISVPEPVEFPTGGGEVAYGFFYAPVHPEAAPVPGERPPLLVRAHGGPTSAARAILDLEVLYWTTRGFAFLDVNYGGSTGYGRAYRERLNGSWGIVDVEDCIHGARFLCDRGLADPRRLAIRGGSAGGYTALCAVTFHQVFAAAASYYGVSDLERLRQETHKFESRYLDRLVGPYPERRDLYRARSPLYFAHQVSCPLLVLQGLEDPVVPPNQAELLVEALRARGTPVTYLAFPGERHGFRRSETIARALQAELSFYAGVFGFHRAEPRKEE